ncbi:DNA topoisomerase IV subunit A [Mycoplasmoides genitalium]|uniref:DNA topoisomerase IV subunit A n=1 Tax=Mycoplasmoides genitalium TaxID=2097 RepID=UPI0040557635
MDQKNNNLFQKAIEEVFAVSFSKYAKYIIQDRALPDLRDGLKPVQRRILYGMFQMGLKPTTPYKKSARAVGEIMGKYHPHGDISIYDAIIRMSQSWKNNWTTVSIHGNNGSVDGDNAAAMRYTETRLSLYGFELLKDIDKKLVSFINNFDDSEKEPTVLPTLLPNLFINGASGIAAGYATNIAPHNTNELLDSLCLRIDQPDCELKQILKIVKGPDFPTGGNVYFEKSLSDIYQAGKGKFIIQAKYEVNKNLNQIEITQIPYETLKANIIKQIEEIIFDNKLSAIESVIDSSDRNGIRIIIKHKDFLPAEKIMAFLFKHTQLQVNFNLNNTVIANRFPIQIGLLSYLDYFLKFCHELIINKAKYELELASKRLEIILGLIKAISIIDKIIKLIRSAVDKSDAREKLIDNFKFTFNQAEAIVSLRLYQLTNTDIFELNQEQNELEKTVISSEQLIASEKARNKLLKKQFEGYKKQFHQQRRSQICGFINQKKVEESELIENKTYGVLITKAGNYHKFESNQLLKSTTDFKSESDTIIFAQTIANTDQIFIVTSLGNIINIPVYKLAFNSKNKLASLVSKKPILLEYETIVFVGTINSVNQPILVLTSKLGMVKRIDLTKLNNKPLKATLCISLRDKDQLVSAFLQQDDKLICLVSDHNYYTVFHTNEIPLISSKGMGVKGMKLKLEDQIKFVVAFEANEPLAMICSDGSVINLKQTELVVVSRMATAKKLPVKKAINYCFSDATNTQLINFQGKNGSKLITTSELNQMSKTAISQTRFNKLN